MPGIQYLHRQYIFFCVSLSSQLHVSLPLHLKSITAGNINNTSAAERCPSTTIGLTSADTHTRAAEAIFLLASDEVVFVASLKGSETPHQVLATASSDGNTSNLLCIPKDMADSQTTTLTTMATSGVLLNSLHPLQ
jgi:hypothetical protein